MFCFLDRGRGSSVPPCYIPLRARRGSPLGASLRASLEAFSAINLRDPPFPFPGEILFTYALAEASVYRDTKRVMLEPHIPIAFADAGRLLSSRVFPRGWQSSAFLVRGKERTSCPYP